MKGCYVKLAVVLVCILGAMGAKYKINIDETTVSGLSSGGFMAVQFHYAYSQHIKGAAVFAGGPYFCALGNMQAALTSCMSMPMTICVDALLGFAKSHAESGAIDSLDNIKGSKVYLFSGTMDFTVQQGVQKKNEEMYTQLGADVKTEFSLAASHCFPTNKFGNQCMWFGSPFINNCGYDGAYESLNHILGGSLNPPSQAKRENLLTLSQTNYAQAGSSLHSTGYLYVPDACKNGEHCRLHIAFHGCSQTLDDIGTTYVENTGINEVAESNNIIVLYPQVKKSMFNPSNPQGCFDWWGYTEGLIPHLTHTYSTKKGLQMSSIWNMANDLVAKEEAEEDSLFLVE